MKTLTNTVLALSAFCSLAIVSCSKNASDVNNNSTTPQNTSTAPLALTGKWTITSYSQRTEDKTPAFAGYVFTFTTTGTNNGTVAAVNGSNTVNGTWTHQPAVTYYGSISTESVTLNFGSSSALVKLSKVWNVSSANASRLALTNPEVAEGENLQFTAQ